MKSELDLGCRGSVKAATMERSLRAILIVTVALVLRCASVPALGDSLSSASFDDFVPAFVGAWEAKQYERIDELVDSGIGFLVMYNPGVATTVRRFRSVADALEVGDHGYGYIGGVGFGDCKPKPGPVPRCSDDGLKYPGCRFGTAQPEFLEVLDAHLRDDFPTPEARQHFKEVRDRVASLVKDEVYFISDQLWGAAFYFVRSGGHWILLGVDTSDCSA
jgi:hypothetical protein